MYERDRLEVQHMNMQQKSDEDLGTFSSIQYDLPSWSGAQGAEYYYQTAKEIFDMFSAIHAQEDIFKKHGVTKEPLTLSKGKYKETFYNEEVMQIGTVLINTQTEKVIRFLDEDSTKYAYKAETTSRFLTVDPLAEEYYSWSP